MLTNSDKTETAAMVCSPHMSKHSTPGIDSIDDPALPGCLKQLGGNTTDKTTETIKTWNKEPTSMNTSAKMTTAPCRAPMTMSSDRPKLRPWFVLRTVEAQHFRHRLHRRPRVARMPESSDRRTIDKTTETSQTWNKEPTRLNISSNDPELLSEPASDDDDNYQICSRGRCD